MKKAMWVLLLGCFTWVASAAELAGVFVDDEVQSANGQTLVLNGIGLREKFWIDVYVGSLYLTSKSQDVAEILSQPGPWRIQLDFIYKEVSSEDMQESWKEGFENNQTGETLQKLQSRIDRFYDFFNQSAVTKDRYVLEYIPGTGTNVSKNGNLLGSIEGEDFKNALLEIWLGNEPADRNLKRSMLGIW